MSSVDGALLVVSAVGEDGTATGIDGDADDDAARTAGQRSSTGDRDLLEISRGSQHDSWMKRVLLLIMLASCTPTSYTYSPTILRPVSSRSDDCSFEVATSTPSRSFEEVGTLQHYNGTEPSTVEELRKAVAKQVCGVGGDAVIAIADNKGHYTKGTIIHYVPEPGPPIPSPATVQPKETQKK
jgi:hypothetical protein